MYNTFCVTKELAAVLLNQLPTTHQPAIDLLFLKAPCWFDGCNALATSQLARMRIFAVAPASKPRIHHAAALQAIGCG